jgi:hypothetical protein
MPPRKRKDKDGLLIFFDATSGRVLWIQSETKNEYQKGLNFLLQKGFQIQSVTIDGGAAGNISIQKVIVGKRLKYVATHFICEM